MRDGVKRTARVGFKALAAAVDPLLGRFAGPRILIYHQVGADLGREMEVSTEAFVSQLDWMEDNGEIVDLATAWQRRGEPDADRIFVLTFDDGFEDMYRNAFPVLKRRALPFTLYLTTDPIQTGRPLDAKHPTARPLTWDQVNEMIDSGLVTVGAHTHSHPDLRRLSMEQVAAEVDISNGLIAESTGQVPADFTYPWGWWSAEADALIRDRYRTATLGSGSPVTAGSDPYLINRIPVQRSDGTSFLFRKLRSGGRLEDIARRRLHDYAGP